MLGKIKLHVSLKYSSEHLALLWDKSEHFQKGVPISKPFLEGFCSMMIGHVYNTDRWCTFLAGAPGRSSPLRVLSGR